MDFSSDNVGTTHYEKVDDEVKQALRQGLLHEAPIEVIEQSEGRIKIPSNGRFTQAPVAVTKDDGSVSIKEYATAPQ